MQARKLCASALALLVASPTFADTVLPLPHLDGVSGQIIFPGAGGHQFQQGQMPSFGGDIACPAGNPTACAVNKILGQTPAPSALTDATNPGNVKGTAGTVLQSVMAFLQEAVTVRAFGARCDGNASFDDGQYLKTMATHVGHVVIPQNCTAHVSAPLNLAGIPIEVKTGGSLLINGVTATFGVISAPATKIFAFSNGGVVSVQGRSGARYPEWWGVVPDSWATGARVAVSAAQQAENTVAMNAAVAAGPGLLDAVARDYTFSGTLVHNTPFVCVAGHSTANDQATFFHLTDPGLDQYDVGKQDAPYTAMPVAMYGCLHDVLLIRDVAPNGVFGAFPYTQPAKALSIVNAGQFDVTRVHAAQSRILFYQRNTADVNIARTLAEFNFASYGGDAIGYFIDGQDSPWRPAGNIFTPNASTTMQDTAAVAVGAFQTATISFAYRITGNFSDQTITNPSAAGFNGIIVDGTGTDTSHRAAFNNDLHVRNPLLDGIPTTGTQIKSVPSNLPVISFEDGYVAMGGTGLNHGVEVDSSNGVTFGGGFQVIGWTNSYASSICMFLNGDAQITIGNDVNIMGCEFPLYATGVSRSEISPRVHAFDTRASANPAITLIGASGSTSVGNHIAPIVDATVSGAFKAAVGTAGAANTSLNSIDLTKTNASAFTGGQLSVDAVSYASSDGNAPYFGKRLGAGNNLVTGLQP